MVNEWLALRMIAGGAEHLTEQLILQQQTATLTHITYLSEEFFQQAVVWQFIKFLKHALPSTHDKFWHVAVVADYLIK